MTVLELLLGGIVSYFVLIGVAAHVGVALAVAAIWRAVKARLSAAEAAAARVQQDAAPGWSTSYTATERSRGAVK